MNDVTIKNSDATNNEKFFTKELAQDALRYGACMTCVYVMHKALLKAFRF